jgi:hypothetical protein
MEPGSVAGADLQRRARALHRSVDASLYQLVDYPEVRIASTDGIDRVFPLDLPWV